MVSTPADLLQQPSRLYISETLKFCSISRSQMQTEIIQKTDVIKELEEQIEVMTEEMAKVSEPCCAVTLYIPRIC